MSTDNSQEGDIDNNLHGKFILAEAGTGRSSTDVLSGGNGDGKPE